MRSTTHGMQRLLLLLLAFVLLLVARPTLAQSEDDGSDEGGSGSGNLPATTTTPAATSTLASVSGTATPTTSIVPLPTYTNVVLDLAPTYQPNFFLHRPLPTSYYGSARARVPDIYFRDCNYRSDAASIVNSDLRLNVTGVYAQFDEDLADSYIGRQAPTKGTLRLVAVGEIGTQAHAADNITNYLSAISIQSSFLTFPVFSNLTYLCDRIFPTTADLLNPLITPTSCAYGPGPVAFGVSIPIDSPYYLGSISTQLRLSDPSKPAKNIACISVSNTPYRPQSWYWSFMLWLPIATFITYFVLGSLARLLTALSVLRARFANRAREGTGPSWVRDKLRPTLVSALSGEHLQASAGLLRFASPGCWDIIYHLQFVVAIAMINVHWPDWSYPFFRQAAWASLLGNVTVLHSDGADAQALADGYMPSGKIDVLRTFAALPVGDIGEQITNNVTSPLYMNTNPVVSAASRGGGNRFLNLNDTEYGIPRYGYMVGLHEQDLWPTAAVIWLYLLAGIVGISLLLWLADSLQARLEVARHRRHADDLATTVDRHDSSAAILGPRSPAASISASLNFPNSASNNGTLVGVGGPHPPPRSPGQNSIELNSRRPVNSLSTNAGDGYMDRPRNSISDVLGSRPQGDAEAKKELDLSPGHVPSPGSSTTRWGQYRILKRLGSNGGVGKQGTPSGSTKGRALRNRRNVRSAGGAPAKLHLSALHGNVIRLVALFHFPLTFLSVWGFQSHGGTHSTTQQALAALFFAVVCVSIPLYAVIRIARASNEELYEDSPTFIQLGPLYNTYAPGTQRFVVALFFWTLSIGIVVGAGQASGSAQTVILLVFEVGMSIGSSLWLPWGEGSNMGPMAFVGSVLRIITSVLLVLLSPMVGFGPHVAGWITYVILLVQAIWFVGAFLIVLFKLLELLVRIGFNVPYEEGPRTTYSGLGGAIRQIRRRQDKILQLGTGSPGGHMRRPGSRASGSSMMNLATAPASANATANKPIQLTHSRQVSYASYLDNPRMAQQASHGLNQQSGAMYGPYSSYFQSDPHDEGGIMAAMPPSSPGLAGTSHFGWGTTPTAAAGGPHSRPRSAGAQQPGQPQQQQQQQQQGPGKSNSSSPPSTGFVRLGGGRATDAQPWQSIPGTAVSSRPGSGMAQHQQSRTSPPSTGLSPSGAGAGGSGGVKMPSPADAAAVAAARRRPRPQSQTAIVGFSWADAQGGGLGNSPTSTPRNELATLPDHRSSFTALVQSAASASAVSAAAAGSKAGDSSTAGAGSGADGGKKTKRPKPVKRMSGSTGFWARAKAQGGRGKQGTNPGDAPDESLDEEDEDDFVDDEDERAPGGSGGGAAEGSSSAAGGGKTSGGGGKVWSGLKSVVGGLRPGGGGRRAEDDGGGDAGATNGFELETEEDAPKTTGFEVVRKPRRPAVQVPDASSAGATSNAAPGSAAPVPPAPAPATGTPTPASPVGDGSLPPLTDLGRLNAGLGLDFAAAGSGAGSVSSPASPLGPGRAASADGQTSPRDSLLLPPSQRAPPATAAADEAVFWRRP